MSFSTQDRDPRDKLSSLLPSTRKRPLYRRCYENFLPGVFGEIFLVKNKYFCVAGLFYLEL